MGQRGSALDWRELREYLWEDEKLLVPRVGAVEEAVAHEAEHPGDHERDLQAGHSAATGSSKRWDQSHKASPLVPSSSSPPSSPSLSETPSFAGDAELMQEGRSLGGTLTYQQGVSKGGCVVGMKLRVDAVQRHVSLTW